MPASLVSQFRGSHWYGVGKTDLQLGPFVGGLHTNEDRKLISPQQLSECVNYLIKDNGSLVGRPKAVYQNATALVQGSGLTHRSLGAVLNGGYTYPLFSISGGTAPTTFWYFRPDLGTWNQAFVDLANLRFPRKYLFYNDLHWIVTDDQLYSAPGTGSGQSLTIHPNYAAITSSLIWDQAVDAFILHDRMIVVTSFGLFWSKATDPDVWAAPDGGSVFNPTSDMQYSALMYQDGIYIFGSSGIWRFSFSTDPSVDAIFEQIYFDPVWNGIVVNNEIYFCSSDGVFHFANGFATEISHAIQNTYQASASLIGSSSQIGGQGLRPGLSQLGNLLLVGPFNTNDTTVQPSRSGTFVNGRAANWYYVYDLSLGVWTNWLFSAEETFPVGGPVLPPVVARKNYNDDTYYWVTVVTIAGAMRSAIVSMSAKDLVVPSTNGYDVGVGGNTWIGYRIATGFNDLGDGNVWKRFFTALLDATLNAITFATGTGTVSAIHDGSSMNTQTNPDTGRLDFGSAFRFKSLGFLYDCLTGVTISSGATPNVQLNSIRGLRAFISRGRKVTQ